MKKTALIILGMMIASQAFAAEVEAPGTPQRKLQRGFLNVALAPLEIPHHLSKAPAQDSFPPAWLLEFTRGSFAAFGRAAVGAYEMITFPIAAPAQYEPIILPEFAWEMMEPEKKEVKARQSVPASGEIIRQTA